MCCACGVSCSGCSRYDQSSAMASQALHMQLQDLRKASLRRPPQMGLITYTPSGQAWHGGCCTVALPPGEKVPGAQAGQFWPP